MCISTVLRLSKYLKDTDLKHLQKLAVTGYMGMSDLLKTQ